MQTITDQQITQLASIVAEDCGSSLTDDQLKEYIYLLLENIAGFEQLLSNSDDQVDRIVQLIKRRYHDQNR